MVVYGTRRLGGVAGAAGSTLDPDRGIDVVRRLFTTRSPHGHKQPRGAQRCCSPMSAAAA
jgi:hypothetical protein